MEKYLQKLQTLEKNSVCIVNFSVDLELRSQGPIFGLDLVFWDFMINFEISGVSKNLEIVGSLKDINYKLDKVDYRGDLCPVKDIVGSSSLQIL